MSASANSIVTADKVIPPTSHDETAATLSNQSRFDRLLSTLPKYPLRARELLSYLVFFLLIYSVCYAVPYGFSDDYTALYSAETKTFVSGQFTSVVEFGRPLLAYLYDWSYSSMHDLADLRYLRVISIIGIALCAWLVYLALRKAGMAFWPAFLIPIVIFSLPSYQLLAAWSQCAYYSYAALLAGSALMLTDRAFALRFSKGFWCLVTVATVLVLASLMVYQPAATMFWFFAAISLLVRQLRVGDIAKRLGLYLAVAVPAFFLEYESLHVLPQIILGENAVSARTQLVQDIPGKAIWFLQQPVVNALNLTDLAPTYTNAVLIGVFVLAGLCLYFKGAFGCRLLKLVLALSLVPLSYLPNLVVADNWAAYRTLIVLGPLVALYYALAIIGFINLFDYVSLARLKGAAIALPLGFFAIYCGISAASNVAVEFALPQYTELQFLNSQLQPVRQLHPHVIYFVPSSWADAIAPIVRYDEFGLPSSYPSWTPQGMVYLTLQESDPADENVQVKIITASEIKNLPAGSVVVDMDDLKYEQLALPTY